MKPPPKLEDLIGLEHTKLGFFKEVQKKIAELRASNLELERKQQEIQAILDGITDIIAVISLDFRVLSVNHVFFEAFDYQNPFNQYCYHVFRNRNQPCPECPVLMALETNQVCRKTMIFPLKGKCHHFEITASPLRDPKGYPTSILLLKRDVTLEKEYQAKFYQAEKMATIGLLAAGVAHEINNPLTAISGFAEGLKRRLPRLMTYLRQSETGRQLQGDFEEYVETILSECNRCRDIVSNLLTFGPRQDTEFSLVNLNKMVLDVLKLLRHQLKYRPKDLIWLDLATNLPEVNGNAAELKQVILNLVLNALDAIKEKGTITLRTFMENNQWVVLSVEDTGYGIPPKHLNKLFEPFFTTKPVGQGIGIGLSICYNIIKKHHGEIEVKSIPKKGSTFQVKLFPEPS